MLFVMGKVRLDRETADRMLAGMVDPADAPPGFEAVGELLEAARTAARRPALTTVAARPAVDLGLAAKPTHVIQRRRSMLITTPKLRLSALAAAAALSGMTGAAYAAGLPAAASSTASAVLQRLGITAPGPNSQPNTRPAATPGSPCRRWPRRPPPPAQPRVRSSPPLRAVARAALAETVPASPRPVARGD
jgi:hypothetical protein